MYLRNNIIRDKKKSVFWKLFLLRNGIKPLFILVLSKIWVYTFWFDIKNVVFFFCSRDMATTKIKFVLFIVYSPSSSLRCTAWKLCRMFREVWKMCGNDPVSVVTMFLYVKINFYLWHVFLNQERLHFQIKIVVFEDYFSISCQNLYLRFVNMIMNMIYNCDFKILYKIFSLIVFLVFGKANK